MARKKTNLNVEWALQYDEDCDPYYWDYDNDDGVCYDGLDDMSINNVSYSEKLEKYIFIGVERTSWEVREATEEEIEDYQIERL